jgi:ADP-ribose pyrophosphatase
VSAGVTAGPDNTEIADEAGTGSITARRVLATGFRPYERISFTCAGESRTERTRDVLRAGSAAAVLPLDLARQEIVVLRQFRLAAQLANGKGNLVEIVAGHVEAGEQPADTARRECIEEIGLEPSALIQLFSYLTSPGMLDEEITLFLGAVDSSKLLPRGGVATEHEEIFPMRVPIDAALSALARGAIRNGPLIVALHWLALNRNRLAEILARG